MNKLKTFLSKAKNIILSSWKAKKLTFLLTVYTVIGLAWAPIFISAWVLRLFARVLLAISYFGMLDFIMASVVFKSLFKKYD